MDELYNHSSFIDLILAFFVGLRASVESTLTINPLLSIHTQYFAVDNLRYRGHDLAIAFDRAGSGRYKDKGCVAGLCLWVGGQMVASRPTLGKLHYTLH